MYQLYILCLKTTKISGNRKYTGMRCTCQICRKRVFLGKMKQLFLRNVQGCQLGTLQIPILHSGVKSTETHCVGPSMQGSVKNSTSAAGLKINSPLFWFTPGPTPRRFGDIDVRIVQTVVKKKAHFLALVGQVYSDLVDCKMCPYKEWMFGCVL